MIHTETHNGASLYGLSVANTGQPPVFQDENDKIAALSFEKILTETNTAAENISAVDGAESAGPAAHGFLSFIKAVVDIINPLQHIPVISAFYRQVTGDEIGPVSRVAGDTLYGGIAGAAIGIADVVLHKVTGKDMGETALAMIRDDQRQDSPVRVAGIAPVSPDDIIWDDQQNFHSTGFPSSPTPTTPYRAGMDGNNGPAVHSTPIAQPVLHEKGTRNADAGLTAVEADSTNVLHPQEAPAVLARMAGLPGPIAELPQDQIASRMMEALDKYRAMQLAVPPSAASAAAF